MDEIHTLRVLRISSGRRNRRERIEQPVCREKYQMASAASVETREPVKIRSHTHRIDSDTLTPAGREAGMCDAPIRYTVYEACSWPAAAPWGPWLWRTQAGDKSIVDCRHGRTDGRRRRKGVRARGFPPSTTACMKPGLGTRAGLAAAHCLVHVKSGVTSGIGERGGRVEGE